MSVAKINISGRCISVDNPPYIIAELSANHNRKLENGFRLIAEAKKAGVDAVKIQTYKPETITLNSYSDDFKIKGGLWDGRTLYELYEEAHTPWEWHKPLFDYAKKIDITILSSPFDNTAIDFLENLNAPAYKIASPEIVDLSLIKYAASTGKPIIISTGMANEDEIADAVNAARDGGCKELAILRCVSSYPAPPSDYNLRTINDMITRFNVVVGLSDHTIDNYTAIASVALGSSIIEKHFTLDRNGGGPDDSFSLESNELRGLCHETKNAWLALGNVKYGVQSSEKENIKFRRSLYFVNSLQSGQQIEAKDLRSVRPGLGMAPKYLDQIVGRRVKINILKNTPVTEDCFD